MNVRFLCVFFLMLSFSNYPDPSLYYFIQMIEFYDTKRRPRVCPTENIVGDSNAWIERISQERVIRMVSPRTYTSTSAENSTNDATVSRGGITKRKPATEI